VTTLSTAAEELRHVAHCLGHLAPSSREPERYFLEKNDLISRLHKVAGQIESEAPARQPQAVERGKFEPGIVQSDGRIVRAEVRRKRA
jgi:hypothetical protein